MILQIGVVFTDLAAFETFWTTIILMSLDSALRCKATADTTGLLLLCPGFFANFLFKIIINSWLIATFLLGMVIIIDKVIEV